MSERLLLKIIQMNNTLSIKEAVEILKTGGIVVFPTDTAFGMGCVIDNEISVERLFRIRQRPKNKPAPVLFSDISMVEEYIDEIPEKVKVELLEKYWPGALTVILKVDKTKTPELVRGSTETLGVRVPNNEAITEIIRRVGKPVIGTSANFHGRPTPYTFESVDRDLISLTDGIVKGSCVLKRESTVIDCTQDKWQIIRQGAIKISS